MPMIRVQGTDVEVVCRDDETILAAFQRSGFSYIIGCKRGGCGICKLDLIDGDVSYPTTVAETVLPAADRATVVLSCRAVPVTDVTVHMPPDAKFKSISPFLAELAKKAAAREAASRAEPAD